MKETMMSSNFAGKTALFTGAGRGIDRAVALGLAGVNAGLILLARSAEQLAQTEVLLQGRGVADGKVRIIPADLSDEEQRSHAAAA
jgi:short-subunit dehydrogenase